MGFIKPLIWVGLAGTVAAGAAIAVVTPQRAHMLMHQVRSSVNDSVDSMIDDPVALREQLKSLEAQYPKRIGEVRSDHSQLQAQIDQLVKERNVAARVVQLADADLHQMKDLLANAETARTSNDGYAIVRVRFDGESLNLDEAYGKANQISQLRSAYAGKVADLDGNLELLNQQEARLGQLLAQLETERAEFQSQLFQLDRQVDAIARNDRMIDMLERRQKAFDKYDRYESVSLDKVQGQISVALRDQEARLNELTQTSIESGYVSQAKRPFSPEQELQYQLQIGREGGVRFDKTIDIEPAVIEITPDGEERTVPADRRPLASRND